jgi:imidazolonepropionase-like amidohydrolase
MFASFFACASLLILLAAADPGAAPAAFTAPAAGEVAVRAGTIHTVQGETIEGGGTVLVRDKKIVAVGRDVRVPPGTRVVDYGPDAVLTPGLVAADSTYGLGAAAPRTAEPGLRAIDGFDPYSSYVWALSGGVTSAYLAPARGRLIAGQGAVVKLAGARDESRVLSASAVLQGAISAEARRTPGFWEPPVPATIDVGLGVQQPQLPRTVAGAIVALRELLKLAQTGAASDEYGPYAGPELAEILQRKIPWRMGAQTAAEVRALLEFKAESKLPIVVDGANGAGELAAQIAAAGVDVIVDAPVRPNASPHDWGKGEDDVWPRLDVAARLAEAGCRFAIALPDTESPGALLFAARAASRGGLGADDALRAITLSPAEILGVADRVGSLAPGKDADLVVLNGPPLAAGTSVLATWVDGELAWEPEEAKTAAVVIEVDRLFVGDGEVLTPGQVLIQDGRIVEVAPSVGRPAGAKVVHGRAAMPGMIDALGHLGLEGSSKVPATRFELRRLVEPGDFADRRVARSGVTTVALAPRGASKSGAPIMAYKPAAQDDPLQVVEDPAALRFQWTDRNRVESGDAVRDTLKKAVDYAAKWKQYEEDLSKWTPPAEGAAEETKASGEEKGSDEAKSGEKEKDKENEGASEEKKPSKKKSKKKKDEEPARPITGAWVGEITLGSVGGSRLRLYVSDVGDEAQGSIHGSLRCEALTEGLIDVSGTREARKVSLSGYGTRGPVALAAELEDPEEDDGPHKLVGTVTLGSEEAALEIAQTSTEYEIARRPERRRPEVKEEKRPKGEPKPPRVDPDLEPLRRAFDGEVAIVVDVDRQDEILACVDAFEEAGLKPILHGAADAYKVADRLKGRVAGVLLSPAVVRSDPRTGAERHNRYAELVEAGIPVAFQSDAEEGAAEIPVIASYAVSQGMSASSALRALTSGAAEMLTIADRVGRIAEGLDGDILLLDGDPLDPATSVVRVWVDGREVH